MDRSWVGAEPATESQFTAARSEKLATRDEAGSGVEPDQLNKGSTRKTSSEMVICAHISCDVDDSSSETVSQ